MCSIECIASRRGRGPDCPAGRLTAYLISAILTAARRRLPAIVVAPLLLAGCPPTSDPNGSAGSDAQGASSDLLTAAAENAAAVRSAVGFIEARLVAGDAPAAVAATVAELLRREPRAALVDHAPGDNIAAVDFVDGESHCFLIIDARFEPERTLDGWSDGEDANVPPAASRSATQPPVIGKRGAWQANIPGISGMVYAQPARNRAFVANALSFLHPDWSISDTTPHVARMLEARGYEVWPRPPADANLPRDFRLKVEHFRDLTQFGVVLIEAHGKPRSAEFPQELFGADTCGGGFSSHKVLTTTPLTRDTRSAYYTDIFCGRLSVWDVSRRDLNGTVETRQYLGVTPNYVREHDPRRFPRNTVFLLNACRGFADNLSSAWRDLLYEKCDEGATALLWSERVDFRRAAQGTLRLFQLVTATNDEVAIGDKKLMKRYAPPLGGNFTPLLSAWGQLDQQLFLTDLSSGAVLYHWIQGNVPINPTLVPQPLWWSRDIDGAERLGLFSDSNPTVTVGGRGVTARPLNGLNWANAWSLSTTSGASGDLVVTLNGISSIPRTLRRWRPVITVSGVHGALTYTVNIVPQGRATLGVNALRQQLVSAAPPPVFDEVTFDPEGSALNWRISGEYIHESRTRYRYQGSGQRAFGPRDSGGLTCAADARSVLVSASVLLTYQTTATDLPTGESVTSDDELRIAISRSGVSLGADWTVAAASFEQDPGTGTPASVSWPAFAPSPPYDASEPR